jgi:dTDP-4-amino-4,6-dideoxygalactose transaminase
MIRLTIPSIEDDDLKSVSEVLASGYLVQGPRVEAFEQILCDYVGSKYAVAVSNGTAALHLSLLSLGVGPGDLVVVTAYSYVATANVIELCGAEPVFVDILPDTFNIDPKQLETTLFRLMESEETQSRVKAILPVHTFGQVAEMPVIMELAERYDLPVVEDAACALGATLGGRQAGTWGELGCFSFHPRKAITTGEGGAIVTDDPTMARKLRALRNHGQDPGATEPDFILPGFNYRLTELQAALGASQMKKLDRIIAARIQLAANYQNFLSGTSLQLPVVGPGRQHIYQSYVTLLPDDHVDHRRTMIQDLKTEGIEITIGTWHMPLVSYYRNRYGHQPGDFPNTDEVFSRSMTLPLFETMTLDQQKKTANALQVLLGK